MPSFDVVSQIDLHELTNAIDQCNREVSNRFDFKGTDARVERTEYVLTIIAPSEFQINQVIDILKTKLSKRGIDVRCLEFGEVQKSLNEAKQQVTVRQGIDKDLARDIVKLVKDSKLKVQAANQGEQIRVTGKKRDDLQSVIAILKKAELKLPLQYNNFRD